ncbi:MAG: potassium-transporting ATPase subunit F [Nostoc sp.]|uniref:potassium-transporting ATPase subunit F n=1 Tax=unclassified Nostoc TaxID=2593658 RepID=UPI0025F9E3D7|nr:potassium-transporting ATPase subunit F [Nostoc sp. NMS9]MBN3939483.1 potassium-transporting ATPase subunit F [Nostoc sp. NMS9]
MKPIQIRRALATSQVLEEITEIWCQWRRQKLPLYLFLAMCFNLVVAPLVYAATGEQLSRSQSWGLGLLGMVTLGLSIYLFFVMFVPEKF